MDEHSVTILIARLLPAFCCDENLRMQLYTCSHLCFIVFQENTTILVVRKPTVVNDSIATSCNGKTPHMTVRWTSGSGYDYHLFFGFVSVFLASFPGPTPGFVTCKQTTKAGGACE